MKKIVVLLVVLLCFLCASCNAFKESKTEENGLSNIENSLNGEKQSYDKENRTKNQEPKEVELISVETPILDKRENRINNIKLVVDMLQGKILAPGEEFSFNDSVGRRTAERGFKEAIVFVDNEKEEEVGGGICQVSSGLYAAALRSGLEVTERHPHQLPVDYANEGEDATVYYGELDLKFVNSTDSPLRMDFYLGEDKFIVTLTKLGASSTDALLHIIKFK